MVLGWCQGGANADHAESARGLALPLQLLHEVLPPGEKTDTSWNRKESDGDPVNLEYLLRHGVFDDFFVPHDLDLEAEAECRNSMVASAFSAKLGTDVSLMRR